MLAPRSFTLWQGSQSTPARKQRHDRSRGERSTESLSKKDRKDATETSRPTTPSSPVVIPARREPAQNPRHDTRKERLYHGPKHSGRSERRAQIIHDPSSIPPTVAALLAVTSIPPPKSNSSARRRSGAGQRLTVDAILQHTNVSEKELSLSLAKSPLDFLLSPPDEQDEDDVIGSETGRESLRSTRTMSSDSVPSLDDESISESPINSLLTPNSRGRRSLPVRRLLSVSSARSESGSEDHPLSAPDMDLDELDFRVFQRPQENEEKRPEIQLEAPRRKSAFKSNLTSSLKALRSAAWSLSSLAPPMMLPDDFLTRSIISIDPQVPFTDERMPPLLEDTPTPALRRYLNPTTNAPIEAHIPSSLAQTMSATKCTASIQMQTYKISRAARSTSPSVISRRTQTTPEDVFADVATGPVARQRDMRENSDFIRIAVMEMAMRRKGKLDEQKPGRARWALPPRKPSTKPYEVGADGVPIRWIAITY